MDPHQILQISVLFSPLLAMKTLWNFLLYSAKTPYYSSGILVEKNSAYTKVYARVGLILIWNREDALLVYVTFDFYFETWL